MSELLTSAQMRAIEAAAMSSGHVTGHDLMERAGRGVVDAVFTAWPDLRAGSFRGVVFCGPGNNGGDGYVIARLLAGWGWQVAVYALGDPVTADAAAMRARWDGPVRALNAVDWDDLRGAALVVDAMFGTGLARDVGTGVWGALAMAQDRGCRIVAVDILSGICADSGRVRATGGYLDRAIDLTVTFERAKLGHHLDQGPVLGGALVVVPIGLGPEMEALLRTDETVVNLAGAQRIVGKDQGHKFTHGHALVLAGGPGRGGAARLAARGALRIGAGLVTVACPPDALAENAARLDAVMLRAVAGTEAFAGVLQDRRINALCLGPGIGTGAREAGMVAVALGISAPAVLRDDPPSPSHEGKGGHAGLLLGTTADDQTRPPVAKGWGALGGEDVGATNRARGDDQTLPLPPVERREGWGARPLVLDADALTLLSRDPTLFAALHSGCVLTPHAGEFARLFPGIAAQLAAPAAKGRAFSKVDATRAAAKLAGCVVLFKGADTVIAAPDGRCAISSAAYDRAAPWLATAGAGDALAGFITGLLARGLSPFEAAQAGAWLHVSCARSFGPGLIAEDLPEELPRVFRALGL
jgi:hydroxyethylthiazole kinase-like uncharacterized protein yjeF